MFNNIQIPMGYKLIFLFLVIQIVTFGAGLFSGREFFAITKAEPNLQNNYTQNQAKIPEPVVSEPAETKSEAQPQTSSKSSSSGISNGDNCTKIKGNISSKSKIYHMPDGAFYDRTQAEICFSTESEAKAAGFVKSSR